MARVLTASSRFRIDWVLLGQLAVGSAPRSPEHLLQLEEQGVGAVLSLCSSEEWPLLAGLEPRFHWRRHALPDHHSGRYPSLEELEAALAVAIEMQQQRGPLFVHCIAAMERSPLLCLAWLMRCRRLSRLQALDYLMQVHPGTMPLAGQLSLLDQLSQ